MKKYLILTVKILHNKLVNSPSFWFYKLIIIEKVLFDSDSTSSYTTRILGRDNAIITNSELKLSESKRAIKFGNTLPILNF